MVKITINDNVTKLKEKSKAKNTQDKYGGDWLKFIDYCKNKYHCNPLEVDDLDSAYALTANYMDWLHEDPEAKILKGSSNIPGRETINNNTYSQTSFFRDFAASSAVLAVSSRTISSKLSSIFFKNFFTLRTFFLSNKLDINKKIVVVFSFYKF